MQASHGNLVGGLGFEPRQAESESAVLPLDDPPMEAAYINLGAAAFKHFAKDKEPTR